MTTQPPTQHVRTRPASSPTSIRTRSMTWAASTEDSRTFHSSPSKSAVCDRFEDPMKAVLRPDARSSNQAFRMELRRACIKGDTNLSSERNKLVDGALLRSTHVGRGYDADTTVACRDASERFAQVPHT